MKNRYYHKTINTFKKISIKISSNSSGDLSLVIKYTNQKVILHLITQGYNALDNY